MYLREIVYVLNDYKEVQTPNRKIRESPHKTSYSQLK